MKQKLLKLFFVLSALLTGLNISAQTEKFYLGVTGYNPTTNDPVKVDATVYDDYSFVCKVPAVGSDVLGANKATIDISMTNVASLGVEGTRSISKTLETGVTGVSATLSEALPATYSFEGATVPVTVIDAQKTTANFTYNIAGITADNEIIGTPSSTEDARTAWQAIVKHVTAGTTSTDDSFVGFKEGTYIQFGDERLEFDTDVDVLKSDWTIDGTVKDIQDAVHVESNTATGADTYKAIIYLPAGSTLDLGSSYATLDKDAKITLDASNAYDLIGQDLTGQISGLRDAVNKGSKSTILFLVQLFDNVVGLVDYAQTCPATVEFFETPKFELTVTGYNPTTEDPVKVDASVYGDYSFVCTVPAVGSDVLGANKATIDISMTNVASLGVSGTRSISKTLETGVTGVSATLSEALPATYSFEGATVPVKIIDSNVETGNFTYNIAGIANNKIIGTPSSTEDARTAWQAIVKHVTAGTTSTDDSFVGFKEGTYIQFGDERLEFDTDVDVLKGEWTIDGTVKDIQDAVHVESNTATGADTYKAIFYLPAGSTLDLGSSYATLDKDAKITLDASNAYDLIGQDLKGQISGLRDAVDKGTKSTILFLIQLFDNVVGLVDYAQTCPATVEFTEPRVPKFYMSVTGYNPTTEAPVKVDASVYDDYSFVCKVPAVGKDVLGANKATVDISMTNVASLGVSGTRSISKTLETGVTGVSATLSEALPATYSFEGATVPVKVIDSNVETGNFTYNIAGIAYNKIIGTPSSTEDARTAWQAIVKHVTAGTTSTDDSFVGFKEGTYIQFGDERLDFDTDVDVLRGDWTIDGTVKDIQDAVHVESNTATGADTYKAIIYLPAGSTLDLGSSYATLDKDAKITLDASNAYDLIGQDLKGQISGLRDAVDKGTKSTILFLIQLFDNVVGLVDYAQTCPATVEFVDGPITVYPGSADAIEKQTAAEFKEIQKNYPNAIGVVDEDDADYVEGLTNAVVKYAVGKKGYYYECENFVLTDMEDFYSPVDFTALNLSYTRTNTAGYNSVCMPFAITNEDVNGTIQTFSVYSEQESQLYFTSQTNAEAGIPCIVYCASGVDWNITKQDVDVVANPISSTNMQGSFIEIPLGVGFYKLNSAGTKYVNTKSNSTCTAFRSYLDIDKDSHFDIGVKALNVVWGTDDDATAITTVAPAASEISEVYSVSGAKLNGIQKGVNIVKMTDGSVRKVIIKYL